jgi:hypothetical protein
MGQPILVGHHSEKRHRRTLDRSWDALGRAVEQTRKAEMHESKAANLEAALDRTIFSDDDNAVEAIEARIAEREAARERMKTVNKLYKKADVEGLKALGLDYEKLKAQLAALGSYFGQAPHMPYELSNMGGRIQADKKRLEAIKMQSARKERAEAAGGVAIVRGAQGYAQVTFAEKPDYSIIRALKDAGFHWSGGSWFGTTAKLPACVVDLAETSKEPEPPAPRIIKGCPRDKWDEVQAIQHEPFIYIQSNGSRWAGEEEGDIAELLETLGKYRLDYERFPGKFYSVDPCAGVRNPDAQPWEPDSADNRHWIDGPRLYEADGVYGFFGNFLEVSHVFNIDTNHKPTIDALISAIGANKELPASATM